MFKGNEDEVCQFYIKKITKSIQYKRAILKIIAILLTIFLILLFSEIAFWPLFYHNLGLGWFGFILSYILIAIVWLVYSILLCLFQSKESDQLLVFVDEECDPLRASFIYNELIIRKVLKEEVVCMDLITILKMMNHKERIRYLLDKYPKAGQKTNQRMNAEFFLLDEESQKKDSQNVYTKNMQFLKTLESKNKADSFLKTIDFLKDLFYADYLRYQDNYQEAITYYLKAQYMSPAQHILISYKLACCYLELKDFDGAKEELNYVIDHGKSMYVVTQAKELLQNWEENRNEC